MKKIIPPSLAISALFFLAFFVLLPKVAAWHWGDTPCYSTDPNANTCGYGWAKISGPIADNTNKVQVKTFAEDPGSPFGYSPVTPSYFKIVVASPQNPSGIPNGRFECGEGTSINCTQTMTLSGFASGTWTVYVEGKAVLRNNLNSIGWKNTGFLSSRREVNAFFTTVDVPNVGSAPNNSQIALARPGTSTPLPFNAWYNFAPAYHLKIRPSNEGNSITSLNLFQCTFGPFTGSFPKDVILSPPGPNGCLNLPDGRHHVSFFTVDNTGAWTALAYGLNVGIDRVAPVTVSCSVSWLGASSTGFGGVNHNKLRITVSSTDQNPNNVEVSGVTFGDLQVRRSTNGVSWSAWSNVSGTTFLTNGNVDYNGVASYSYQFKFRAADAALNSSSNDRPTSAGGDPEPGDGYYFCGEETIPNYRVRVINDLNGDGILNFGESFINFDSDTTGGYNEAKIGQSATSDFTPCFDSTATNRMSTSGERALCATKRQGNNLQFFVTPTTLNGWTVTKWDLLGDAALPANYNGLTAPFSTNAISVAEGALYDVILGIKQSPPSGVDLTATFITPPPASVTAGSSVSVTVEVRNIGSVNASTSFIVSVYPKQTDLAPLPSCPGLVAGSAATTISSLGAGATTGPINLTFTAPSSAGSYVAVVQADSFGLLPNCTIVEANETNNRDIANYNVAGVGAWFDTIDGNIAAAGGGISVNPPLPISTYSLIANGSITGTTGPLGFSDKKPDWLVKDYPLVVPRSSYSYFDNQFSGTATPCNPPVCSNGQLPTSGGVYKYTQNPEFVWDDSTPQTGSPFVLIIDGDMEIQQNLTGRPAIYIISGDLDIHQNVREVEGFFIVGDTANTKAQSSAAIDCQLTVKGSIVAHGGISLDRDLAGSTCPGDNDTFAAEVVNFDPIYLTDAFAQLLGSPRYTWREVAP